jgi:hypothetical protein
MGQNSTLAAVLLFGLAFERSRRRDLLGGWLAYHVSFAVGRNS